jgi:hypothetical protein
MTRGKFLGTIAGYMVYAKAVEGQQQGYPPNVPEWEISGRARPLQCGVCAHNISSDEFMRIPTTNLKAALCPKCNTWVGWRDELTFNNKP